MKGRWLIACAGILVGLHGGTAFAVNPDNGPGCGLGKLAWSDYKTPKNIAPQVMMATTNATFGSQTFGISFGTSGCTNDSGSSAWASSVPASSTSRPTST